LNSLHAFASHVKRFKSVLRFICMADLFLLNRLNVFKYDYTSCFIMYFA
jgi:hypothetical protein